MSRGLQLVWICVALLVAPALAAGEIHDAAKAGDLDAVKALLAKEIGRAHV